MGARADGGRHGRRLGDLATPGQGARDVSGRELTLSRANRSVRLFEHVVDSLAAGRQPDPVKVDEVGYVMRTTSVYGLASLAPPTGPNVRRPSRWKC